MPSKSKAKGNTYEREVVKQLQDHGFMDVKRAWGSDGRSLGWDEKVDVVGSLKLKDESQKLVKIQCKRRKRIPKWLGLESVDMVMVREDRGESIVVMFLEEFMEIIGAEKNGS